MTICVIIVIEYPVEHFWVPHDMAKFHYGHHFLLGINEEVKSFT